jgi:hypothetical protein
MLVLKLLVAIGLLKFPWAVEVARLLEDRKVEVVPCSLERVCVLNVLSI